MIVQTLFVAAFLLYFGEANAKDFALRGVGTSTCTEFANLFKSDAEWAENLYFTWTQGFLSGWNFAQLEAKKQSVNLALLDTKAQEASIRRYCDQHPLGNYLDAVLNLLLELQSK
jgi:hypothetical protein